MKTVDEFTEEFMRNLKEGAYEKNTLPNNGPEITKEFADEQITLFSQFLNSNIAKDIANNAVKNGELAK